MEGSTLELVQPCNFGYTGQTGQSTDSNDHFVKVLHIFALNVDNPLVTDIDERDLVDSRVNAQMRSKPEVLRVTDQILLHLGSCRIG